MLRLPGSAKVSSALTTLRTNRLTLRPVQPEDASAFEAFYADPEVMAIRKYGVLDGEAARMQVRDMLEHWANHGFGMWVVEEQASGEFAGECGLRWLEDESDVELSYGLHTRFRGRGLATEAARAALGYGVEVLELERIVAISRGDNTDSHGVLEKLGMTLEWREQKGSHGLVRYSWLRKRNASGVTQ
jgi:ribosomal-protein-alanine N-acetyltransferase